MLPGVLIIPAGKSNARFVGHRPGTEVRWQVSRHLWFQADYGIFYAGKFVKESQPGRNLNYWALWGWLQILERRLCGDTNGKRFMWKPRNTDETLPFALLGMTAVTGLVDAVSFLSLGGVFTANMTGNMVILAFSTARVSGLSIARSSTALLSFLVGAIFGGRIMARASAEAQMQFAAQAFMLEVAFLFAASFCAIGYRGHLLEDSFQPFALIALMAIAMGTRNAAVRKLAIPDLTTTVLTLTITGIAADSSVANGNNPRLARRVESVVAMFLGAALGAVIIHYSISAALWLGTAISALCSAALFRPLRTSGQL